MTRRQKDGRYLINAITFRVVREAALYATLPTIQRAEDAAALARQYLADRERETFIAILLNTRHRVLDVALVSIGGLQAAPVHPREVFSAAVRYSAAAVILAHNHPSGETQPSRDDVMITEQLRAASRLLGIEVLDHIIIGEGLAYSSLRDLRLGFQ